MTSLSKLDAAIVRGLAYYTGLVFEIFDRSKNERALAGGGRYDNLLSLMSDGKVNLPALGFGMGDVVLANLINDTPHAKAKMEALDRAESTRPIFSSSSRRRSGVPRRWPSSSNFATPACALIFPSRLRRVGKQFQTAEQVGAELAVLVGDEWPEVKIKALATRGEDQIPHTELADWLRNRQKDV